MPRPAEGRPASPAVQDCSDAPLRLSAVRAHDAAPRRGETRFACGAGLQRCPAAAERCTGAACRAPTRFRAARGWGGSASWSLRRRIAAMPRPDEERPASPAAQDCSDAPLPLSTVRRAVPQAAVGLAVLQRCPAAAEHCTGAACRAPTRFRAARGWGGRARSRPHPACSHPEVRAQRCCALATRIIHHVQQGFRKQNTGFSIQKTEH
jgi:hypothetical protein